ncbi:MULTISPECIES: hypothetical protein [unclassified Bradyrhizobium]|nr:MULTISPECIES: hypothetical protein [unclassified Bradyrhizobium]
MERSKGTADRDRKYGFELAAKSSGHQHKRRLRRPRIMAGLASAMTTD